MLDDSMSLGNSRAWLRERIEDGACCPCCTQFAKSYHRKLNSSMARTLLHFVITDKEREWFHADQLLKRMRGSRGDYCKLKYWGLTEQSTDNPDPKKKNSGWWKITDDGYQFAFNKLKMLSHAVIYNGKLQRLEGELVSIVDCLGRHFDYRELMRGHR